MSSFFWILQETYAHGKPTKHRQSEQTWQVYIISWVLVLLTRTWTGMASTSSYCVYLLFVLIPHNLRQLPFLPLSPTEYTSTSVWAGMQNHLTVSPPDRRTRPIPQGRRTPSLLTYPPTIVLQGIHCHRRQSCFLYAGAVPLPLWDVSLEGGGDWSVVWIWQFSVPPEGGKTP